jgi:TonB family protein
MCDAAAPKLQESGTTEVVLTMTLDTRGKVESFKTESPKGLRLENMNEAFAAIKAIQFEPAKKNGQPVRYMVRVKFDC